MSGRDDDAPNPWFVRGFAAVLTAFWGPVLIVAALVLLSSFCTAAGLPAVVVRPYVATGPRAGPVA